MKRILGGYGRGEEKLPVYKMPHLGGWAALATSLVSRRSAATKCWSWISMAGKRLAAFRFTASRYSSWRSRAVARYG